MQDQRSIQPFGIGERVPLLLLRVEKNYIHVYVDENDVSEGSMLYVTLEVPLFRIGGTLPVCTQAGCLHLFPRTPWKNLRSWDTL